MQGLTDNIGVLILISMLGGLLLVVSFILIQIRNQNTILSKNKKIQDAEIDNQKNILYATISSQEAERERIGMDLHDEVGTQLSSLRLLIESNNSQLAAAGQGQLFVLQSKAIIDGIVDNVRSISHDLSPRVKDITSLLDCLHDMADQLTQSGSVTMLITADENDLSIKMDGSVALAVYRVIAELVNNTIRHAQASGINLILEKGNGRLKIIYTDDGIGLPAGYESLSNGMGMQNIKNRIRMIRGQYYLMNEEKGFSFRMDIPIPGQLH